MCQDVGTIQRCRHKSSAQFKGGNKSRAGSSCINIVRVLLLTSDLTNSDSIDLQTHWHQCNIIMHTGNFLQVNCIPEVLNQYDANLKIFNKYIL